MKRKVSIELNSVDLIKYALFKEYSLPEELAFLNLTQERILMTVKNSVNVSMVSISRAIGLEKGPFSQTVDKLEKLRLLERVRSSSDKRIVRLFLTKEGGLLAKKVEDSMESHFSSKIKALTDKEQKDLYDSLDTLKKIAETLISK
ncbi:MarR family winged helix-turn-helix transcriptional regulator [Flavobacterium sp. ZS1P14]|uniref:MarR family winged helix-turn-helix transcriptional regulator n=1 Tax=Flavobacterium sp. ZS1P14 TaxID=3401729 RepID=UPI003AAE995B